MLTGPASASSLSSLTLLSPLSAADLSMLAPGLVLASAVLIGALGALHLALTFASTKFFPRDPALSREMMRAHPAITRQTTVWRAFIGFNASHSLGALLFGMVYGDLAIAHAAMFFGSAVLQAAGLCFLAGFAWLAVRYWFSTPRRVIVVAAGLYAAGLGCAWLAWS